MTKKDFIAIAAEFKSLVELHSTFSNKETRLGSLRDAADAICRVAQASNDRFDRARFLTACGLNS